MVEPNVGEARGWNDILLNQISTIKCNFKKENAM